MNDRQFLHDTTGNRRFLCFEVLSLNEAHGVPLEQLYAQLWALLKSGFQYWFDKEEIAELNLRNNEFRFISSEEDRLDAYFDVCTELEATHLLSTTELVNYLRERDTNVNLSIAKMGRVLAAKEFVRLKRNTRYVYALKEK